MVSRIRPAQSRPAEPTILPGAQGNGRPLRRSVVPRTLALAFIILAVLGAAACGSQGPENGAPDFTLRDASARPVTLHQVLQHNEAVVIVFYRGFG